MGTVAGRVKDSALPVGNWGGAAPIPESYTGLQHLLPRLLHQTPAAVGCPLLQIPRFILTMIEDRRSDGKILLEDHFDVFIGRRRGMLDIVDSSFNCPFQAVTTVGMTGDEHPRSEEHTSELQLLRHL